MSEFDSAAWRRAQALQAASDRRFSKKMAAVNKQAMAAGRRGARGSIKLKFGGGGGRATRGQGSWSKAGKTPALLQKIHDGGVAGDAYAERQKGAQLIDSNMLGRNAKERLAEFDLDAARHPRVNKKNMVVHVSLSRPAGGELTRDEWQRVARNYLKQIGADGCQYVVFRHTSTSNDHIHIVFSRSRPDGSLVGMSNNRWSWRAALRQVEADLGITSPAPRTTEAPTPTSDRMVSAQRRAARRGRPDDGFIDPQVIRNALAHASTPEQFAASLTASGINVKQANKNGRVTGILFQKTGSEVWLAGSSIDRMSFTSPKIQAQLELNRQALLKKEQELLMQRQQLAFKQQREQAQQSPPQDRPRGDF